MLITLLLIVFVFILSSAAGQAKQDRANKETAVYKALKSLEDAERKAR